MKNLYTNSALNLTKPWNKLLFVLVSLFPSYTDAQYCSAVSESDSLELVALYEATNGDNWTNNINWLEEPVSQWHNILLMDDPTDSTVCRVKNIALWQNNLEGILPDLDLPYLEELSIAENPNLEGSIPDLALLPNLKELNLAWNNLSGTLPTFEGMVNMTSIGLNGNAGISGEINIDTLPNLVSLSLNYIGFTGTVPDFEGFESLEILRLNNNNLTGEIPNFNLPNLKLLDLYVNQLSGEIPNFDQMPNLDRLHISTNQLSGSMPALEGLPNLYEITINNNQLSGPLPDFSNQPNLVQLIAYNNLFSGNIPNFDLAFLAELNLSNNHLLSGSIPDFNTPNLQLFTICPNEGLDGFLPSFSNAPLLNPYSFDSDCLDAVDIIGQAYYDMDQDCIKDPDEALMPNVMIYINDFERVIFTDENGNYTLRVDTGNHELYHLPPINLWEAACPDSIDYIISANSYEDKFLERDFGLKPTEICTLMAVNIGTSFLRRCFQNTYTVECCNMGSTFIENANVEVDFPDNIIPLESSEAYEDLGNGLLNFNLLNFEIGECQTFTIVDSVSCEAELNSGACVTAKIFPTNSCSETTINWDQSDVVVFGECILGSEGDSIKFTLENQGQNMSQASQFRLYEDDVLIAIEGIELLEDEIKEFTIPDNGATYKGVAIQTPANPFYEFTQAVVEECAATLGSATTLAEGDNLLGYESDCQLIIGSFDPNDKLANPTGQTADHLIPAGEEILYKIRFQNTGNDTALNVFVVDTINTDYFDLSTFQLGVSSHDFTFEWVEGHIPVWTFPNIYLVDSTTNEAESHGFFQFKIRTKADLANGTNIMNEAGIYFDFNEVVMTPPVYHTIGYIDTDGDGVSDIEDNCTEPNPYQVDYNLNTIGDLCDEDLTNIPNIKKHLKVFPNPMDDQLFIQLEKLQKIEIQDINGQILISQEYNHIDQVNLKTNALANGIYFIHLYSSDQHFVQKIVKQ